MVGSVLVAWRRAEVRGLLGRPPMATFSVAPIDGGPDRREAERHEPWGRSWWGSLFAVRGVKMPPAGLSLGNAWSGACWESKPLDSPRARGAIWPAGSALSRATAAARARLASTRGVDPKRAQKPECASPGRTGRGGASGHRLVYCPRLPSRGRAAM